MATSRSSRSTAGQVAFMGLLFALAVVLSFVEGTLPALPIQGVKLGLSNIVTMYCLFFLGVRQGFTIACLKSLFVLLTRGPIAAGMSICGGLFSVAVMGVLTAPKRWEPSYLLLSVSGAIAHNIGQLFMARWLIGSALVYPYLPIMIVSGVGMGILTGILLRVLSPYMARLSLSPRREKNAPSRVQASSKREKNAPSQVQAAHQEESTHPTNPASQEEPPSH